MTQMALFPTIPQKRNRRQEAERIYAAVAALRKSGAVVFKVGRLHKVNGKIVDHVALKKMASMVKA